MIGIYLPVKILHLNVSKYNIARKMLLKVLPKNILTCFILYQKMFI